MFLRLFVDSFFIHFGRGFGAVTCGKECSKIHGCAQIRTKNRESLKRGYSSSEVCQTTVQKMLGLECGWGRGEWVQNVSEAPLDRQTPFYFHNFPDCKIGPADNWLVTVAVRDNRP